MDENLQEKEVKKPSSLFLLAQSMLTSSLTLFAMGCGVIISAIPAYGFLFLWNKWLAKFVGAEPLTSVWNVFGFMACVIVAINIISVLVEPESDVGDK
jgi:hypothetical protein